MTDRDQYEEFAGAKDSTRLQTLADEIEAELGPKITDSEAVLQAVIRKVLLKPLADLLFSSPTLRDELRGGGGYLRPPSETKH